MVVAAKNAPPHGMGLTCSECKSWLLMHAKNIMGEPELKQIQQTDKAKFTLCKVQLSS